MQRIVVLLLGAALAVAGMRTAAAADVAIGMPAPEFSALDTQGARRALSDFTGQFVVLEWFNKDCPFVRKHYGSSNMQRLQETYTARGVIWLTIASSAPGKQGYMTADDAAAVIAARGAHQTALLRDPDGTIGRRYGAKTTPHLFVIDPNGILIYMGAIDDHPSVDPADIAQATNYVAQALDAAMSGQAVAQADTPPYGCGVKYAE